MVFKTVGGAEDMTVVGTPVLRNAVGPLEVGAAVDGLPGGEGTGTGAASVGLSLSSSSSSIGDGAVVTGFSKIPGSVGEGIGVAPFVGKAVGLLVDGIVDGSV